jgi:trehalose-6-phosphatase
MLMPLSKPGGDLNRFDSRSDVQLSRGSKVIEIRNAGIDKGPRYNDGYPKWLCFLLALGDDSTDEEIFAVLPRQAYSIHVESLRVSLNLTCMTLDGPTLGNSWLLMMKPR